MKASSNRSVYRHTLAAAAAASSLCCLAPAIAGDERVPSVPHVQLSDGTLEGIPLRGQAVDVRAFRGIPYAAPPVDGLRFREPQAVARWAGVRDARAFGPRCMQTAVAGKLDFRSTQMSEDCLYLNVWTSASGNQGNLPVLVYFHGGGFVSGDGSEPRYDGANLASRGIVVVTVNYRLGVFGFLAPAASSESSDGSAGNFGLLDQVAALRWVRENIGQFGGDPSKVTIAGNSAGSISVSAHMASPRSRGLFARAIGLSGAAFEQTGMWTRDEAERAATVFSARVGATSLQQLRSLPAQTLLTAAAEPQRSYEPMRFRPHIDGSFLTESPEDVFVRGGQTRIPLLAGSIAKERAVSAGAAVGEPPPEKQIMPLKEKLARFVEQVDNELAHYPGTDHVIQSTRRWSDLHRQTGGAPVFIYRFTQRLPLETKVAGQRPAQPALGSAHDAHVPYLLGNLQNVPHHAWTPTDHEISRVFSHYVEQFVKAGSPNGSIDPGRRAAGGDDSQRTMGSVASWPALRIEDQRRPVQIIGERTHSGWDGAEDED